MSATSTIARRREFNRWRSPVSLGDIARLIACCLVLLMPLLTLEIAGWQIDLNIVLPALFIGVVIGILLAGSRFGELPAIIISSLYAIGSILFVSALSLEMPFLEGIKAAIGSAGQWALDAMSDGNNPDELVFTMLVSLLFWFLAYNATWHIYRIDRVWRVILPPGLVLLVNMVIYSGREALDRHLVVFLLMSLSLIARSNLENREWEWSLSGIRVPAIVRRQFAALGIALSLLGLGFAWGVPTHGLQERLNAFQEFLASDPIQQMSELWSRLFAPIEGDGPATTDYYGADLLNLGGAVSLGDDVVLLVDAPHSRFRYYWRSRVFERYIDGQWSPSADLRITDRSSPLELNMSNEVIGFRRQAVSQHFTIVNANARIYYAAPQPSIINSTGRIDLIYTDKPENSSMNVSVARPLRVMKRGESYSATSLLSVATAQELRGAGANYPDWVSGANLYVGQPNARILNLSQQIVDEAGARNPYDRAKAIETWLRANIVYNESIPAPPPNMDSVEWVLFDAKEGYCTYYATSMIVMLRHLGIPARLAAGFSQGPYDANIQRYVVREREAHTWVEVYFPGYGWIEFEPTAAEAPYNREGDDLAQPQDQPADPQPTISPSPTPTPSPTPRPTEEGFEQIAAQPTPTPTLTPTLRPNNPSPTPFLVPTVEPPIIPDEPPPPFAFLEPLILVALVLLVSLLILAIILLLLFWWWEWRGMGGLSPISRAYARLERYILLIGIDIGSNKTTLEKRRELQQRIPAAREPIRTISDLYTRERYGDTSQGAGDNKRFADRAERAWNRTRGNIIRRWLRRLLPFRRRD
ncbi:MAG: transglutaminaseTgpA domain-containing protein [Chloroflexota bacterium]|nr:transglutaminaseTgpA domain-containing protein [Chloroflexota bacterium]